MRIAATEVVVEESPMDTELVTKLLPKLNYPAVVSALEEIAARKMQDLNANDIQAAAKIIAGTARSMGVTVEG